MLVYQILIVAFCCLGAYVAFSETFSRPDYAVVRVVIFGLIIAYAIVPLVHQIMLHGFFHHELTNLASGFLIMIAFYAGGALIYVRQWPERWAPGTFDIWGHSHQIWHLCVTAAAYTHYITLHEYLDYRKEFGCMAGGDSQ